MEPGIRYGKKILSIIIIAALFACFVACKSEPPVTIPDIGESVPVEDDGDNVEPEHDSYIRVLTRDGQGNPLLAVTREWWVPIVPHYRAEIVNLADNVGYFSKQPGFVDADKKVITDMVFVYPEIAEPGGTILAYAYLEEDYAGEFFIDSGVFVLDDLYDAIRHEVKIVSIDWQPNKPGSIPGTMTAQVKASDPDIFLNDRSPGPIGNFFVIKLYNTEFEFMTGAEVAYEYPGRAPTYFERIGETDFKVVWNELGDITANNIEIVIWGIEIIDLAIG